MRLPYRHGLEPSRLNSLVMITRAPAFRSPRRLGLVRRMHACTMRRQTRRSGWDVVSRCPTRPLEGSLSGRGSDAVHYADIRSADFRRLEGVPIRRPLHVSCALSCPGSFGGKAAKRSMGRKPVPYHAPMTCVLGGEASGAFNAPARVRESGRGRRPCARHPPVRVSLFRIRW